MAGRSAEGQAVAAGLQPRGRAARAGPAGLAPPDRCAGSAPDARWARPEVQDCPAVSAEGMPPCWVPAVPARAAARPGRSAAAVPASSDPAGSLQSFAQAVVRRDAAAAAQPAEGAVDRRQAQADGRAPPRQAADCLNSPPTPRIHARRPPETNDLKDNPRNAEANRCVAPRPAWSQISDALPMIFDGSRRRSPTAAMKSKYGERVEPFASGGDQHATGSPDHVEIMPPAGRSAKHWCRRSRMNSTAPHRCRACALDAEPDRSASLPTDCPG